MLTPLSVPGPKPLVIGQMNRGEEQMLWVRGGCKEPVASLGERDGTSAGLWDRSGRGPGGFPIRHSRHGPRGPG